MRPIFLLLSILTGIIGLIFILRGTFHPGKYKKELSKVNASAVRVTQVYSEATHSVVVGVGIVSFGVLITFIGLLISTDDWKNLYTRLFGKIVNRAISKDDTDTLEDKENEG